MPLSMYQSSVPVFIKTLTSLKSVLEKGAAHAQAKKIDETVLLQSRLYPDMLPLTAQVQIAADMARGSVDRFTGSEPASWEDNEKTFADLINRLDRTIAHLKSVNEKQLDDAETRSVTRKLRGQPKTFTAVNYLQQFVLPNLFFHATTAYAILRHSGVELGKLDFLGPLD
jgi:hypothetical protein